MQGWGIGRPSGRRRARATMSELSRRRSGVGTTGEIDVKMIKAGLLCFAMCAAVAPKAAAQMTWTDNGFANISVGGQAGSHSLATSTTFPLYDETATAATAQKVKGGGLFDVSAGYKVWRNLAVGIGFSSTSGKSDTAVAASIPDPLFFDRPRAVTASATGLKHSENVVHLMAVWMVPVTDKIDVAISAGPSIFSVKQDVPASLTIAEPGPTVGSVAVSSEKKTSAGVNVGVDVAYMLTKRFGVGGLARYTGGSVTLPGTTEKLTVGGFQIGGGLRVRF
ncbi:MAG: outer membrane beta-barrel protein [Acidobacteriota bacterium]